MTGACEMMEQVAAKPRSRTARWDAVPVPSWRPHFVNEHDASPLNHLLEGDISGPKKLEAPKLIVHSIARTMGPPHLVKNKSRVCVPEAVYVCMCMSRPVHARLFLLSLRVAWGDE